MARASGASGGRGAERMSEDAGGRPGTLLAPFQGMRPLAVSELMTAGVVTVPDDATLSNVDWEMALADVRHVPVVDSKGCVCGIVSDRDLLRSMNRAHRGQVPVSKIMTAHVLTTRPETPARDALEVLLARKVSALVVVDDDRHPVGIVTATDFLDLAFRALTGLPVDAPHAEA